MNRLLKSFYRLTGGRPMKKVDGHTAFAAGGTPVGYWRDKFGRLWLADMIAVAGGWQLFRIEPCAALRDK